jgi:tRNA (guanine-N7-)-methyltransferase
MSRLRKAGKIWKRPGASAAAERVMFEPEDVFAIDPAAIFARVGALEVEMGEFIVEHAAKFPERNFLAVELSGVISRMLAVRCGSTELGNVRVVRMDARTLVNLMLPDVSVSAFHIYFPDPWPKERHHKHRMFTERIAASLRRTLAPGGRLYVATDVPEYAAEIEQMLSAGGFTRAGATTPGAAATGFGRKFLAAKRPVFQGEWKIGNCDG